MSSLQVPAVTLEDLQAFQTKHFPVDSHTEFLDRSNSTDNDAQNVIPDDEDLGYYPDGVERTLTDEQIEIFRHSEIHALLRQKQLREEELAEEREEEAERERLQREEEERSSLKEQTAQSTSLGISAGDGAKQIGSLTTQHATTTRHAEDSEPSRVHKRMKVAISNSTDVDYDDRIGDGSIEASGGQEDGAVAPNDSFTRRRIISYDD